MTTAGHYAVCRPVRLSWFENDHGEWHWLHTDDGLWEVICAQCGDRDGPPDHQEAEIRELRGPYPHEQAREVVIYHAAGGVHPELADDDGQLPDPSWRRRPAEASSGRTGAETVEVDGMVRGRALGAELRRSAGGPSTVKATERGSTAHLKRVARRAVARGSNTQTRRRTRELGR